MTSLYHETSNLADINYHNGNLWFVLSNLCTLTCRAGLSPQMTRQYDLNMVSCRPFTIYVVATPFDTKGHTYINNIPIDGQSLCNTVEPFAALFWAIGIVLATTPDPPRRPDITVLHHRTHIISLFGYTLLEKQSKFPRYNMKCRGKHDTIWNIPRSITFSMLHFMLSH